MPKVGDALGLYEVGATIIPVLFASLIFEAKALERSDEVSERWSPLLLGVAIVLSAVAGEVAALNVLATQHPTHAADQAVIAAIMVTGASLLVIPVAKAAAPIIDGSPNKIGLFTLLLFLLLGTGILLGLSTG